ncbi:MAG TPA: serine/threonine-protein kinase [Vicinamibacterales bacterium]|nr:serine/threonine-protein kinase [Vicinamibacterales bacterium]
MEHKLIARRQDTGQTTGSATRSTGPLPEELLSEEVRRLSVFAAIAAAVWTFGLFMDLVFLPATGYPKAPNWRAVPVELFGSGASLAMYLFARLSKTRSQIKTDAGFAFMIANAFAIALLNAWAMPPVAFEIRQLSWVTILILVYSMIAPSSPRRTLMASLAAATMDPVCYALAHLLDLPAPSLPMAVVLCWPNYACAVIAMVPSKVLQRFRRRLREAQELGSYHLVELLGRGGMGEVWRAEHRLLARQAAVKLVRPEVLGARNDQEARVMLRRFEREAQATSALSSPHTIQVFDFGVTQEGTFYYVMELLVGRDLESLVREFGPVPASRAIFLLRQVAHSLADAHARDLVHRDIKPANIYVCRMGLEFDFVKVLDFGLVKSNARARTTDSLATLDHTTTGTPAYMAPEIILGSADVDRRADVYALGCVAYYLLTGELVFQADTPMKMLVEHLHTEPVPPSARTELPVPEELDRLVLACLQKDPRKRPQSAGELFRMALKCQSCEGWTWDTAQAWWQTHLPDLSGPLTSATDYDSSVRTRASRV